MKKLVKALVLLLVVTWGITFAQPPGLAPTCFNPSDPNCTEGITPQLPGGGLVSDVYGLGEELAGLVNDFSASGLADFACNIGRSVDLNRTVPDPNDPNNQTDDPDVQGPPSPGVPAGPSGETKTLCQVSNSVNKLEQTLTDSRESFLATAGDVVFTDLASAGWFNVENYAPDSAQVQALKGAIETFDELRTQVSAEGEGLAQLYAAGKEVIDSAKALKLGDTAADEQGGAAFTAAREFRIEQGSLLQENNFKSKVTQKAAQELSNSALEFAGETEVLGEKFSEQSFQRQDEGIGAVSTRAATQVAINEQADTMRQFSMNQIQTSKQLATIAETQVMTVSQLSLQNEEIFRQAQEEIDQAQARDKEQLRREQEMVDETTQLATDVAAIFGTNLPRDE